MARGGVVDIVALVLAWGSTFAALKIGLDSAPPFLYAGIRVLVSAVLLCLVAWRSGGRPELAVHWRFYASASLLSVALFYGLQTVAVERLPSGLASVLIYFQPVLVGLLAWRFLGEPLTPVKLLGLMLGFTGIAVVSAHAVTGHLSLAGTACALGTAVAWALGTIQLKQVQGRVDPWWALAVPFSLGGAVLALLGLVTEGHDVTWSRDLVLSLAYVAVIGTTLAWVLWQRLLLSGDATRAAAYVFFVPITALVVGVVVLGEDLGPTLVIGALLVVVGVRLVNRPERSRRRRRPAPVDTRSP